MRCYTSTLIRIGNGLTDELWTIYKLLAPPTNKFALCPVCGFKYYLVRVDSLTDEMAAEMKPEMCPNKDSFHEQKSKAL